MRTSLLAALLLFGLSERTEAYHRGERLARARLRQSSALAPPPRARAGCSIANGDEPAADGDAEKDRARLELGRQKLEEIFAAKKETTGSSATALSVTERLLQQLFPSSQFVGGGDLPTKFLFVDELVCIGCTHCRYVAPKTFMLEEEFGRARVFKQGGDISDKIDEAIECCPVECIHQVSHTELVRLEEFRAAKGDALQGRFWKSRLVGSEIGIPKVPNWWEPLLDQSQPAWAGMISGPTSMSALGFLGPAPSTEPVELDMWGNPVVPPAAAPAAAAATPAPPAPAPQPPRAAAELCDVPLDVCDLVDCADDAIANLAAQLERSLALDGAQLCDLVDCAPACADGADDDEGEEAEDGRAA